MSDRDACAPPNPRHAVSRRDFLGHAGRLAGGVLVLGAGGTGLLRARPAAAAAQRAFVAGRFALVLDGSPPLFLQSFEGGTARGEVVPEAQLGKGPAKKHLAGHRFDPIALRVNLGGSKPLLDQVQKLLVGEAPRLNGAIVATDPGLKVVRRLEFTNAQIGEVVFPALDGASKESAFVDVTLVPEHTSWVPAKGDLLAQDAKTAVRKALLSSFELKVGDIDCSKVQRIEALTIRSIGAADEIGAVRELREEPGRLEVPNLVVKIPEASAKGFQDWHKSFVLDGKNGDADEKQGTLRFLDPARKEALLTIGFEHLGIFALAREAADANAEASPRLEAEMYCEAMSVSVDRV